MMTANRSCTAGPLSLALGMTMLSAGFSSAQAACTTATPCVTAPESFGTNQSTVEGVSLNGTIVVGQDWATNHAFRWVSGGGGGLDLGTLGGTYSIAYAVSADGSVVVGYSTDAASLDRAFRWTAGTGMMDLGTLGGTQAIARGVSSDGSVVVGNSRLGGGETHAFRWTAGTGMQDLGVFAGGTTSFARGVSGDGFVVVGDSEINSQDYHAFRWTAANGMVDIGTLGGASSSARGTNADGSVIVGEAYTTGDAATHAFRWTSAGMTDLGTLEGGNDSRAFATSADGSIVVGRSSTGDGSGYTHAFRWTAGSSMKDLNTLLSTAGVSMSGILLTEALAISPDGQFIGGVGNFGSNSTGFLVRYFDGIGGVTNYSAVQSSLDDVANAHRGVMAQQHGLLSGLLGNDKPMTSESYAGAFASAGSASVGGFTQLSTGGGLSLLGGVSYGTEDYESAEISDGVSGALAVRYMLPSATVLAPFVEGGGWLTRNASLDFDRTYANGAGTATGRGSTEGDISYLYGRAGLLYRPSTTAQLSAAVEVGRERLSTSAYSEKFSAANPFEAYFTSGSDVMDIAKLRLQWSQSLTSKLDMTLWAAGVRSFNSETDVAAGVAGFGTVAAAAPGEATWVEYGARLGYKVSESVTVDAFTNGVSGNDSIGTRVHGGADVRVRF